jgi:hypothetical protein
MQVGRGWPAHLDINIVAVPFAVARRSKCLGGQIPHQSAKSSDGGDNGQGRDPSERDTASHAFAAGRGRLASRQRFGRGQRSRDLAARKMMRKQDHPQLSGRALIEQGAPAIPHQEISRVKGDREPDAMLRLVDRVADTLKGGNIVNEGEN